MTKPGVLRSGRARWWLWPVSGLAILGSAAAQAPVRGPHPGRVLDDAGQPLAGVEVTFLSVEGQGATRHEDLVKATADARGRYRVSLLPTRPYLAWAARHTEAGSVVTEAVPRGAVATDLRFAAEAEAVAEHGSIRGVAPWLARGPLRAQLVVAGSEQLVADSLLGPDGRLPVPALPPLPCELRMFLGEHLVHLQPVGLRSPMELPPPQQVAMVVRDEHGAAVAGAQVFRLGASYSSGEGPFPVAGLADRYLVATTDGEGKAEVLLAAPRSPYEAGGYPPWVFVASKAGFAEAASGFAARVFLNGKDVPDGVELERWRRRPPLSFVLRSGPEIRRRLLAAHGSAPARVRLVANRLIPLDKDSNTSVADCQVQAVAGDGTFAVPDPQEGFEVQAIELPLLQPQLAADDPFRRALTPRTLVLPGSMVTEAKELDLRALGALRLQVLDPQAGPAMGAKVLCVPSGGRKFLDARLGMRGETDAAGRIVMPVLPGTWLVVVVSGATWGKSVLVVVDELPVQTLSLGSFDRMVVRVVDGADKPIAGVHFNTSGAMHRGGGSAEQDFLSGLGYPLASWLLPGVVTGDDGRAAILFLASPMLRVDFIACTAARRSAEQQLIVMEEPTEIVIQ